MCMTPDYTPLVVPVKLSANNTASGKWAHRLQPLHRDHQSRPPGPPHQPPRKLRLLTNVNPSHSLKTIPLLRVCVLFRHWLAFASRRLSLIFLYTALIGYRCLGRKLATVISVLKEDQPNLSPSHAVRCIRLLIIMDPKCWKNFHKLEYHIPNNFRKSAQL